MSTETSLLSSRGRAEESDQREHQDAIWDYFQNEAPESFSAAEPRLRFLASSLRPNQKVLNIGVGSGLFEDIAADAGIVIHSLDPNQKTIESLRRRLGVGDRAKVGYGQQIPFASDYFDSVVASEVLEHIPADILCKMLPEISRVLVDGGTFLGTVPSRERLRGQVVVCPHCESRFHRWGHVQSFDPDTLRSLLEGTFASVTIHERPFLSWKHLNWKGRIYGVLKLIFSELGIRGANENLVFVARKP